MKTPLRFLIAILLCGAAYWAWTQYAGQDDQAPPQTARVTRGFVSETVLASGTIEAKQLISVGARTSGQIETMAVSLGQTVVAGDLIAQIDSQDQQNDVLQAEAELANINAQIAAKHASLKKAQLSLNRLTELNKQNYASQEDVESAIADLAVYEAELEALDAQKSSAEVNVSTAKIALDRTTVTAPISGTVVAVVVDEGQTVNANTTSPTLVKLANLDKMLVKAEISEADVVHVAAGQKVSFTILGEPDNAFAATVRNIEPAPSEIEDSDTISSDEAIYYNGILEVDNPDHVLRIGMTTQVSVVLDEAVNVLTVPAAALNTGAEGQPFVMVYDATSGAEKMQPIEVGLNDKVTVEIISGLSEGDLVVTGAAVAASTGSAGRMGPGMGF